MQKLLGHRVSLDSVAAATLGAQVIEVHVTFSRAMFGPDVQASVTLEELRQLVVGVRFIERMRANPVDKDVAAEGLRPLRDLFTKSVVAARPLDAGTVLERSDILTKKPGTGIPGDRLELIVGRRLRRSVDADELLREEDLE